MKPGAEYELYVKQVYQMLVAIDLPECKVQHNVILKGLGGIEHQIDVYWEFTVAGVLHRTAVECKDYNRNVSKERIAAFRAVLDDIGGIRGIYATKIGYQSGAKEFAKQHNIDAMIIRPPEGNDWEGWVKEVHVSFIVSSFADIKPKVIIDADRIDKKSLAVRNGEKTDIKSANLVRLSYSSMTPDIQAVTMQDLMNRMPRCDKGVITTYGYDFEDGFIDYEEKHWPVKRIEFEYTMACSTQDLVIIAPNDKLLAYVKNILTDSREMIKIQKTEVM